MDINSLIESIKPNTILISLMLANNETGVIQVYIKYFFFNIFKNLYCLNPKPVKMISKKLKELGFNKSEIENSRRIYIHTDAAQAIGKINVDVEYLEIDYLTIVGHKVIYNL